MDLQGRRGCTFVHTAEECQFLRCRICDCARVPGAAAGPGPRCLGTPPIDPHPADPVTMQHDSDAANAASESRAEKRKVAAASHRVDRVHAKLVFAQFSQDLVGTDSGAGQDRGSVPCNSNCLYHPFGCAKQFGNKPGRTVCTTPSRSWPPSTRSSSRRPERPRPRQRQRPGRGRLGRRQCVLAVTADR